MLFTSLGDENFSVSTEKWGFVGGGGFLVNVVNVFSCMLFIGERILIFY